MLFPDGADTVFDEQGLSVKTITVKNPIKKGTKLPIATVESTDTKIMAETAAGQGVVIKAGLAARVANMLIGDAGTKIKFADADASMTGAGTAGKITYEMFLDASQRFSENNVPRDNNMNVLVSPLALRQIKQMKDSNGNRVFIPVEILAKQVIEFGKVGKVDNWNIIEMNGISKVAEADGSISATAGNNVRNCITFYHKDCALWGAEENIKNSVEYDTTTDMYKFYGLTFWGAEMIFPSYALQVRENNAS